MHFTGAPVICDVHCLHVLYSYYMDMLCAYAAICGLILIINCTADYTTHDYHVCSGSRRAVYQSVVRGIRRRRGAVGRIPSGRRLTFNEACCLMFVNNTENNIGLFWTEFESMLFYCEQ